MSDETSGASDVYDPPAEVADRIRSLAVPTLLVFDCDGVLAPLVDHADDSVLSDGVRDALVELSRDDRRGTLQPAILSGRSLEGLAQFDFPAGVAVVGSYGNERRGSDDVTLNPDEVERLERIDVAVIDALETAGDGAWIERKPASVVLHVREADDRSGVAALEQLADAADSVPGAVVHHGADVVELMARASDKGTAIERLRSVERPAAVVYLGDDIPDEDAFAVLGEGDLSVKVGPGETVALLRLDGPDAVVELLAELAQNNEV